MSDKIESKMEFIIQQQATFAVDIADLKEVQRRQSENIDKLTLNVKNLANTVAELTVSVSELREDAKEDRVRLDLVVTEMRHGFDNLIIANEVTRKLAEDVRVEIAGGCRVNVFESSQEGRSQ
jgi:hypothetical protein